MRFPGFVDAVSRRSGLPPEQAAAISRAVVATMAERVTGAAVDDPLSRLPDDLGGYLTGPPADPDQGTTIDLAAGSDEGTTIDLAAGSDHGSTIDLAAGSDEGTTIDLTAGSDEGTTVDLTAGSTPDPTVGPGGPTTAGGEVVDSGASSPAEFLRRVGERAGVDPATARVGTGAVFATLREAVTVGEFQQLVAHLPESFRGPAGPDAHDDGRSSAIRPPH